MAEILSGKPVSDMLLTGLKEKVFELAGAGRTPVLGIVRLGSRPDDLAYERSIERAAGTAGVEVRKFIYSPEITTVGLAEKIEELNADEKISGVLIFRPLPSHIDESKICNTLSPAKDVDGITDASSCLLYTGAGAGFAPCTAQACIEILKYYNIPIEGKSAAVIGRSLVIGKPVAQLLLNENATVTVCHSKTENLAGVCRNKDIIIAAAGRAGMVGKGFFNPHQTVLDVAINFDSRGRMCGDADFEAAKACTHAVTPVPGGVGSVTTAVLMKHVTEAAEKSCKH